MDKNDAIRDNTSDTSKSTATLIIANIFFPGVAKQGPYHHNAQYRDVPKLVRMFLRTKVFRQKINSKRNVKQDVKLAVSIGSNFWDVGKHGIIHILHSKS